MNKKRSITYGLILLLMGSFTACNKSSEELDLQIAQIMEAVPTPLPFVDDPQVLVPIDEEHFEGDFLRALLKQKVDLDGDGYLSKAERERVDHIGFDLDYLWVDPAMDIIKDEAKATSYETFFQYFPNLKRFECPRATAIVVRNHNAIRNISHMCETGTRDIIVVEGCLNFMGMYAGDVCKLVSVTDVPQGSVAIETNNLEPKYVFDGNLFVYGYLDDSSEWKLDYFLDEADITWVNVNKSSIGYKKEDVEPLLQGALVDSFSYEVSEKTEDIYDENGVKGYDIYVDTKEMVYSRHPFKYSLYCNQKPETGAFKTKVSKVYEFIPVAYSPNRGVYGDAFLTFDVIYVSDEGEQVIDSFHKRRFCFIEPDGEVSFYSTEEEWNIPDYEKLSYEIENPCYLDIENYAEYYEK